MSDPAPSSASGHGYDTRRKAVEQAVSDTISAEEARSRALAKEEDLVKVKIAQEKQAAAIRKAQHERDAASAKATQEHELRVLEAQAKLLEAKEVSEQKKRDHDLRMKRADRDEDAASAPKRGKTQAAPQPPPPTAESLAATVAASSSGTLTELTSGITNALRQQTSSAMDPKQFIKEISTAADSLTNQDQPPSVKVSIPPQAANSVAALHQDIVSHAATVDQAKALFASFIKSSDNAKTSKAMADLGALIDQAEKAGKQIVESFPPTLTEAIREIQIAPGRPIYWCALCNKYGSHSTERCFKRTDHPWSGPFRDGPRGGPPPQGPPPRQAQRH